MAFAPWHVQVYAGELEERYCQLLRSGMAITVNSDDPAYFGGYINDNYAYVAKVGHQAKASACHNGSP